ncbi:hypothetical protein DFJ58DRAFT_353807 [Suillus subalutaceus]|uniref:uncharacterized protein n=1 Tax=Suillus subalutaceus TaxID=48586 RepID=UPI001B861E54|nr:uncharacterized protein DFJ58DRAFT_353807 [Suillus subalutaceus]KAG1826593.1 hypothetical protein DFJ58DRAFT_353807 [Suillus subalutaceus]
MTRFRTLKLHITNSPTPTTLLLSTRGPERFRYHRRGPAAVGSCDERGKKSSSATRSKKDKITQSMNFHKGFISPLWRFPDELLSQIFHHCFPDTGPKTNHFSPSSRLKAPMIGVCRRWREVATSTPSLVQVHVEVDDTDWQRTASCYDSWLNWSDHVRARCCQGELRWKVKPAIFTLSGFYVNLVCRCS